MRGVVVGGVGWSDRSEGSQAAQSHGDEVPVAVPLAAEVQATPPNFRPPRISNYFRLDFLQQNYHFTATLSPRTPIHFIYFTMPSRGNPNVPNKQRKTASRAKVQKRNAANKVSKNPRGTARSDVLHPTSGPLAPVSGKKARKLQKLQNNARRRALEKAMEQEGEVEMTGE